MTKTTPKKDRPLFEASRQPQNHSEEDRKPKLAAAAPQSHSVPLLLCSMPLIAKHLILFLKSFRLLKKYALTN